MSKKTIISGITATGTLTIGNYIGAIKNFVKLQNKYEMYIFVADLHALTIDIDPKQLSKNRKNIMALYVAAGIDPNKAALFYQSEVSTHGEASFIFENMTTIGELSRMTQYKDKSALQKEANGTEKIKTGLLTYPALMAADILVYNPDLVPVGADQKQHLELTRNIAERFNNKYKTSITIPEPFISETGAKIKSLTDPTKKMSKSDPSAKSYIGLLDDPEVAYKKIIKSVTDSEGKVYISEDKPGVTNLLTIYSSLKDIPLKDAENIFKDADYGMFKKAVAEEVKNFLINLQDNYNKALNEIDTIASEGKAKAIKKSKPILDSIHKAIGLK